MLRWPNVPAVCGWLRLDQRGHWYLIDRHAPGFDERADRGSRIEHRGLIEFIERNYAGDESGRWYFQNGPQRVFVDLDLAPLVLRVVDHGDAGLALLSHHGVAIRAATRALRDAAGNLYMLTEIGPGVVHDGDLATLFAAADAPDDRVVIGTTAFELTGCDDVERELNFVRRPR